MRENRTSGSEGGEAQTNELSLPLSLCQCNHNPKAGTRTRKKLNLGSRIS